MNSAGKMCRVILTVASTAPISLASEAKAPARIKIHTMYSMSECPAERENTSMRSVRLLPLNTAMLQMHAAARATAMGIL